MQATWEEMKMVVVSWMTAVNKGQNATQSREANDATGAEPILYLPMVPVKVLVLQTERERSKNVLSL